MSFRDHEPIKIEEFDGLYKRGDADSCPPNRATDVNNIQYIESGIETRDGLDTYLPYGNILRQYTYISQTNESLLILTVGGYIYHTGSPTPFIPIMHLDGMTDFGFYPYAGRAYINPSNGVTGLASNYLWVYKGDGTPARLAAGTAPVGGLILSNSSVDGDVEAGIHVFAVAYETDTGFITKLGGFNYINAPGGKKVSISVIPTSASSSVVARRLVATKAIAPADFDGNVTGYQFFFFENGRLGDNVDTTFDASFFDSALLEDASYLLDIFEQIPAGVGLNTYHGRLLSWAESANISVIRASNEGDPETISQVDGLIVVPLDGLPLTNAQEYRDVLYVYKRTKTISFSDNGDVPSSWPFIVIDNGVGTSVHGIAAVLDSEGINIEFLLSISYSGVMIFNGTYLHPELSYNILDFWLSIDKNAYPNMQILNDSIRKIIYINLPDKKILIGDYSRGAQSYGAVTSGLTPNNIRWGIWSFNIETTTISLVDINKLIIGAIADVPIPPPVNVPVGTGPILINVIYPVQGQFVTGLQTLTPNFSNNVISVQWRIDGINVGARLTVPNAQLEIDTTLWVPTQVTATPHTISAIGYDVNGAFMESAAITVYDANPHAITPLPTATHTMYYAYFFDWSNFGQFRSEVVNIHFSIPNTFLIVSQNDPGADIAGNFASAIALAKPIIFMPFSYPTDNPNVLSPEFQASLDDATPFWGSISKIYFDELHYDLADMDTFIALFNAELTSRGLAHKPIIMNFTHNQYVINTGWQSTGIDQLGIEAYLDPSQQNAPNVVDLVNAEIDFIKNIVGTGRPIFYIIMGYDRNGNWTNLLTLSAIEAPVYLKAYNDANCAGMLIFSYGRSGGTRDHRFDSTMFSEQVRISNALI